MHTGSKTPEASMSFSKLNVCTLTLVRASAMLFLPGIH